MKRALREGYRNIPEGEQVVRIASVDESKYDSFQQLTVVIEDATGATANVNFNFINKDETPNDVAEGIYARMCRAALDDQTVDECDTKDLVGRYVRVEIVHKEGSKGGTFANVSKWLGAGEPFKKSAAKRVSSAASATGQKSARERLAEMRAKKATAR